MKKSFRSQAWLATKKIILGLAVSCGLYAAAITNAEASASCDAVNAGAFNLTNPAFDLGNSSILTGWSIGDKITVTFTDAVGFSHTDGLYRGPLNTIASLQTVTVPSGGNASFTYTVVSGDPINGILIDPENNDSVTATCAPAATSPTTTALSALPNPSVFGQPVTFTANVTSGGGTPTGSVTFYDGANSIGSATLVSGTAALQTSSLAVGGHTIAAVYSSDASFAMSTSPSVSQTVNKGATTSVLVAAPNPSNIGQVVTFTATVAATSPSAGTPTGTVTFKDGATSLGSGALAGGIATLSTNTLAIGAHTITAVYGGDANFTGSTSLSVTQTVNLTHRTWVSGVGDDNNDCSRTAPCLTFAGAIAKTSAGGEIDCLAPGGFGAVTIVKSISIVCDSTEGGVLAGGINGFIIDAPAGSIVTLKGHDVDCRGTGLNGIEMINVGVSLHIHKIQIRNCRGGNGILVAPSSGLAKVFVADSYITDNGAAVSNAGILIRPTGGANANVSITRVRLEANTNGIFADGSGGGGASNVSVSNSVLAGNSFNGFAIASAGAAFNATIDHSTIAFNVSSGAAVANASATLRIGGSTIVNNVTGVSNSGGTLQSFKHNMIAGNGSDGSPMTAFPAGPLN